MTATFSAALATQLTLPVLAHAQQSPEEWVGKCNEHDSGRGGRHCETREYTIRSTGNLEISAAPNGGIQVRAWDRNEVRVIAKIQAHAPSLSEAKSMASSIEVSAAPGQVSSTGPETRNHRGWSVSYEVWAPATTAADLQSVNGGLSVEGLTGNLRLTTTNGGISLSAVAGSVTARSTNGGVHLDLARGGNGVDIETTNGSVEVVVPEGVGAAIEASTRNGGIDFDFPVQVQGRIRRQVTATIGGGGPTYRIATTNGGITLRRP